MSEAGAEPRLRPARRDDCAVIAALFRLASHGVADYVWSKLAAPDEDLLEVGRRRYEGEDTPFSYRNCVIAEQGGEVAGMLLAFPMTVDPEPDPNPDPVLAPYARLEEDRSWYVCALAVCEGFRGRGIGRRLMAESERQARARGLPKISLIVFADNRPALALYQSLGYREKARERIVPHPLIRSTGDALLMVKELR